MRRFPHKQWEAPIRRFVSALVLPCALLVLATSAQATYPGANGKIAFFGYSGTYNGTRDIYTINPDGTGETNLTNNQYQYETAVWSPDGTKIAFDRSPPTADWFPQIYRMNGDGSGLTSLTDGAENSGPDWSPDGAKITFTNSFSSIWTMNADGTDKRNLGSGTFAKWSPDGSKLAFGGVTVMNSDGTNRQTLATGLSGVLGWSPDGTKILAYSSGTNYEVWSVNANGSGSQNLTNMTGGQWIASYSPAGTKIVFNSSGGDQPSGIYTMNPDGSGKTWLATGLWGIWSPDSAKIAFLSGAKLYTMNADGSDQRQLLSPSVNVDGFPSWQSINPAPYPRPVGASPMYISLVPAFTPCDSPSANASHPAPLAGRSCNPPVPRSASVAVGPRSLGFTRQRVLAQGECAVQVPGACYPDLVMVANVTDVRSGSPVGPDYDTPGGQDLTVTATLPGSAQGKTLQITDQNNQSIGDPTGPYDKSATVVPLSFPIPMGCTPTSDSSIGSTCDVKTSANSLVPGSAVAGKRAIWELGQVQILDQGADGVPGNGDDQVFEAQGVFVP